MVFKAMTPNVIDTKREVQDQTLGSSNFGRLEIRSNKARMLRKSSQFRRKKFGQWSILD